MVRIDAPALTGDGMKMTNRAEDMSMRKETRATETPDYISGRPYIWKTKRHRRTPGHRNVGPTCPDCQTIHGANAAVAVGRFNPAGARGYRSRLGGPLRPTRNEAIADFCTGRCNPDRQPASAS